MLQFEKRESSRSLQHNMPRSGQFVSSRNMIFPSLVMNIILISQSLMPLQLREGRSYVLLANSTNSRVDKIYGKEYSILSYPTLQSL